MTKSSGTILAGGRRPEGRGARTWPRNMEIPLALALLATTTAVAQNTPPAQQDAQPPPAAPPAQPTPPAPQVAPPAPVAPAPAPPTQQAVQPPPVQPGTSVPQSPPPARYPAAQPQSQTPASPPPPQYPAQEHPRPTPYTRPDWVHTESEYPETANGFHYHPLRFHIDGGGTITQQANDTTLDNGWNAGLGFTLMPSSVVPLGIRVDGTYNHFDIRAPLLQQAAATYGTNVDRGTARMWGGDVDLELDLNFSPYVRAYLLAGGGWYRQQYTYRQVNYSNGVACGWWGCAPALVGASSIVARNTTAWKFAKNAGFGLEFAMGPRSAFFVEARYMRLNPNNSKDDFLPIRAGLRF